MTIYLSGPMSGIPDLNHPAFDKARDRLLVEGHRVVSPADLDRNRPPLPYKDKLRDDLRYLLDCQAIYLLKGWGDSQGACLEWFVALSLGMHICFEESFQVLPVREGGK